MDLTFDDSTNRKIFGHEAAEDEDILRLKEYYFKSNTYERLSADMPLRILIGHKGIGKSAMIAVASHEDESRGDLAILLRPDDVSQVLLEEKGDLNSLIRAWKSGLLKIVSDKILSYFIIKDDGCETRKTWASIVSDTLNIITQKLMNNGIELEKTKKNVFERFSRNHIVKVYDDDLDRGWNASEDNIKNMSAMLNAMRDISRDFKSVRFIVSMRSDVFFLVRTSDESTDKLESSCIWFSWTNHEILAMLVKRIRMFFELKQLDDYTLVNMDQSTLASDIKLVMEPRFHGYGKWENIPTHRMLMTLIRRRPRDLVKLCTLAAQHANEQNRNKIMADDFVAIFDRYSQDRLQDTINEYRSELGNIRELLENMKPRGGMKRADDGSAYVYTTAEILQKINNILQSHSLRFFNVKTVATGREILQFLYKIGFVTARKKLPTHEIVRHFFEDRNYIASKYSDFGYNWEIHPAYRWALSPAARNIFETVDILRDDV